MWCRAIYLHHLLSYRDNSQRFSDTSLLGQITGQQLTGTNRQHQIISWRSELPKLHVTLLPSDQNWQVSHKAAQSLLFTAQKIAVPPCSQKQRRCLHTLPACITLLWLSRIFLHFPGIYQFRVPESSESGTPVGRIRAADKDVGENAEMYFTIVSGDGLDTFDIFTDKATQEGVITVSKVRLQTHGTLITIIGIFSAPAPLFIPLREKIFSRY